MLRWRDMAAAVLALTLFRMAWNDSQGKSCAHAPAMISEISNIVVGALAFELESLSSTVHLAFYHDKAPALSPMDVDGDGTNECLVVAKATDEKASTSSWILQVLDLKPLHHVGATHLTPFRPSVLFQSREVNENGARPLRITTGQIIVNKQTQGQAQQYQLQGNNENELNDRTRHYFCGVDWHDAASKCGTPCPGGQPSECKTDERCFADTPCDSMAPKKSPMEEFNEQYNLTPAGGLPSVLTVWSNGMLSMHSLTSDKMSTKEDGRTSKESIDAKQSLELREMWRVSILPNGTKASQIQWEEISVRFLDSFESEEASATHGMVIVGGSYSAKVNSADDASAEGVGYASTPLPFVVAVDAWTGEQRWDSFSEVQKGADSFLLPLQRGSSSAARRRSKVPGLQQTLTSNSIEQSAFPNCLGLYRHSLRDALPYAYWDAKDAGLMAIHLEQKTRNKEKHIANHIDLKTYGHDQQRHPTARSASLVGKKKWHKQFHKSRRHHVAYGRPNAVVIHSRGGLQIRSLKNGHALCHLSLLEQTLYADLNGDGVIDQVQILLESQNTSNRDKWMWNLVNRVRKEHQDLKEKGTKSQLLNSSPNLCHALATSGVPAREEIFSAPLCGTARERVGEGDHPAVSLGSVAPIAVESFIRRGARDVVIALNNGMVHRLNGRTGRREWQVLGKNHEDFPTWESQGANALLTRVQSDKVAPSVRPIVIVGENSLAVISAKNGGIMATATFPQTAVARPVFADLSGDGTTDVIVFSSDAIWGFQIVAKPSGPIVLRIFVGLLFMGIMLAFLRNRFGQRKDKRSTDE